MKSWFITGASSGIGLEIARLALARGDNVVATARRKTGFTKALGGPRPNLLALRLDVTDGPGASAAIAAGIARFGGIDILVNNAGLDAPTSAEQIANLEYVFQYGVLGLLTVIRAALPHMDAHRSGHILNIGMFDSKASEHCLSIQNSARLAIDGMSTYLRSEALLRGIKMTSLNHKEVIYHLKNKFRLIQDS